LPGGGEYRQVIKINREGEQLRGSFENVESISREGESAGGTAALDLLKDVKGPGEPKRSKSILAIPL